MEEKKSSINYSYAYVQEVSSVTNLFAPKIASKLPKISLALPKINLGMNLDLAIAC